MRALTKSPRRSTSEIAPRPLSPRSRPRSARASCAAPPRSSKRGTTCSLASSCAKPASLTPTRSRKCARRPTSCATMGTRRRARCFPAPLPRLASSSASVPGTFRSPSSRAKSPPRSRPAIPSSPSLPKRRRSSPPKPCARCMKRASRAMRCSSCPALAKLARRWSPTRAFKGSCSPARRRSRD